MSKWADTSVIEASRWLFIETSGLVRSASSAMGWQFCPAAKQRTNPRLHPRQRWEPLRRSERSGEK
jgi:hypothetical protein